MTKKIIIALDFEKPSTRETLECARAFIRQCPREQVILKVGLSLFNRGGPAFVDTMVRSGFDVFLDLKFHDIPHQVALAARSAADLGVWMINVHALGGERMMAAAQEAVSKADHQPLLTAVTMLTSHDPSELPTLGIMDPLPEQVLRLATLARSAGLDGVVCSAHEAAALRAALGASAVLVTPGIRLATAANPAEPTDSPALAQGASTDDQRRTMTPREALAAGSHYLVIGRPITASASPASTIESILMDIA